MKKMFLIFLAAIPLCSGAATRFVTTAGSGNMDGTSWIDSYPGAQLQNSINESAAGDEVWVAEGTYYTTVGIDRNISFTMKNGVSIYGSFSGSESSVSERILTNGPVSILSGGIGGAGINDNSYHVIHNSGLNNSAIIDGFVIRDANDDRLPDLQNGLGGGIYNDGSGSGSCNPVIRNCVIIYNHASFGGGIFNNGYQGGTSEPLILNCIIAFNTATGGAGIDNFGLGGNASPQITNCIIYENTATERGGGMYCWGGNNGNANPVVLNSAFVNNSAINGGAIVSDRLNSGSGSSGNADPEFRNCIFKGNDADSEGPQFILLGDATFTATFTNIDLTGQAFPNIVAGPGTGNINSDPMFTDIENGQGTDNLWMTNDDGLRLQHLSPCIDAGDNTGVPEKDITGSDRIVNSIADMGAYEFHELSTRLANAEKRSLFMYPNPSNGKIILPDLYEADNCVRIINSTGKTLKEMFPVEGEINISDLPDGIYTVILETGMGEMNCYRIIKK